MRGSIRTRLVVSVLVVAVSSAAALSWYFLHEVESYGVRKLLERVDGNARLLAALVEDAGIQEPQSLGPALEEAVIIPGTRAMVLDPQGRIIADSSEKEFSDEVEPVPDFADRVEFQRALEGRIGKAQRPTTDGKLRIYAAYPIYENETIVAVAYSSARTFSIATLVRDYRGRVVVLGVAFLGIALMLAEALSRWLSHPLRTLETSAAAFAGGDLSVRVKPAGSRETRALGEAFNSLADEVERMFEELREEERRKSRFVSDVSHELRTPLTAIRGTAETLLEGDVPAEDAGRFLTTIVREADRLARLADDLLTLQRIEGATGELPLRRVELQEVSERAVEALQHVTGSRGVTVEIRGEAPLVLGDPDRLQQVVANLVDNASRVMSPGGKIVVELGFTRDRATLSVLDEGPGLPKEDVERIFDRFYRSQPSRDRTSGGAGLGLAIVKAIIDRHGGTIQAANRSEGGVRFTVSLPIPRLPDA